MTRVVRQGVGGCKGGGALGCRGCSGVCRDKEDSPGGLQALVREGSERGVAWAAAAWAVLPSQGRV